MLRVTHYVIYENIQTGDIRVKALLENGYAYKLYGTRSKNPRWSRGSWAYKFITNTPENAAVVASILSQYMTWQEMRELADKLQRWQESYHWLLQALEREIYRKQKEEIDRVFLQG